MPSNRTQARCARGGVVLGSLSAPFRFMPCVADRPEEGGDGDVEGFHAGLSFLAASALAARSRMIFDRASVIAV